MKKEYKEKLKEIFNLVLEKERCWFKFYTDVEELTFTSKRHMKSIRVYFNENDEDYSDEEIQERLKIIMEMLKGDK